VPDGADVVLLDLFQVLPGLPSSDREDRVDLAGVVQPVRSDEGHDLWKGCRVPPVELPGGVEIVHGFQGAEPAFVDGLEPVDELLQVLARRFDPLAEPSRPVGLRPVPRFRIERERVVHGVPAGDVLEDAEARAVPAGGLQRLVDGDAVDVVDEHPVRLLEHRPRERTLRVHATSSSVW